MSDVTSARAWSTGRLELDPHVFVEVGSSSYSAIIRNDEGKIAAVLYGETGKRALANGRLYIGARHLYEALKQAELTLRSVTLDGAGRLALDDIRAALSETQEG